MRFNNLRRRLPLVALFGAILIGFTGCASMSTAPTKSKAETKESTKAAAAPAEAAKPVEPAASPASMAAYQQALAAFKAERYADAEKAFLALSQREPKLSGPQANLGLIYARTDRLKEAAEAFKRAIDLNPDRAAYYDELGMVLRQDGKFDDARRAYERALKVDPNYAYAQLNLGILHDLYLQEPSKAVAYYERYKLLMPGEAPTVTKWIADAQLRSRAGSSTRTANKQEGPNEIQTGSTGATGVQ
jgi:tetratricopeptide (TPR) repeat protein